MNDEDEFTHSRKIPWGFFVVISCCGAFLFWMNTTQGRAFFDWCGRMGAAIIISSSRDKQTGRGSP